MHITELDSIEMTTTEDASEAHSDRRQSHRANLPSTSTTDETFATSDVLGITEIERWGQEQRARLLETSTYRLLCARADCTLIDMQLPILLGLDDKPEYLASEADKKFSSTFSRVRKRQLELAALPPARRLLARIVDIFSPRFTTQEFIDLKTMNNNGRVGMGKELLRTADEQHPTHYYSQLCELAVELSMLEKKLARLQAARDSQIITPETEQVLGVELQQHSLDRASALLRPFFLSFENGTAAALQRLTHHWQALHRQPDITALLPEWSADRYDSAYFGIYLHAAETLAHDQSIREISSWRVSDYVKYGKLESLQTADAAVLAATFAIGFKADIPFRQIPDDELRKLLNSPNPGLRNLAAGYLDDKDYVERTVLAPSADKIYHAWFTEFGERLPFLTHAILFDELSADKFYYKERKKIRERVHYFCNKYGIPVDDLTDLWGSSEYLSNPNWPRALHDAKVACYDEIAHGSGLLRHSAVDALFPDAIFEPVDCSEELPELESNGYAILTKTYVETNDPQLKKAIANLWIRGRHWSLSRFPIVINDGEVSIDQAKYISLMGASLEGLSDLDSLLSFDAADLSRKNINQYLAFVRRPPSEWEHPFIIAALRSGRCLEKMYTGESLIERLEYLKNHAPTFFQFATACTDLDWAPYAISKMISPKQRETTCAMIEQSAVRLRDKNHTRSLLFRTSFWAWVEEQPARFSQLLTLVETTHDTEYETQLADVIFTFLRAEINDTPLSKELLTSYIETFKGRPDGEVSKFLRDLSANQAIELINVKELRLVGQYLRTFGSAYFVELYQAYVQLVLGQNPSSDLRQMGVTETGQAGVKQLTDCYKKILIDFIESGDFPILATGSSQLLYSIIKNITRFTTSEWASVSGDLHKIITNYREQVKRNPKITKVPSYYQPAMLRVEPIRQKGDFKMCVDARVKYGQYMDDVSWALLAGESNSSETIMTIKNELLNLVRDMVASIETSRGPQNIKTIQINSLGKDGEEGGLYQAINRCSTLSELAHTIATFTETNSFARKTLLGSQQFRRILMLKAVEINRVYAESISTNRPQFSDDLDVEHLSSLISFIRTNILDEATMSLGIKGLQSVDYIRERALSTQVFSDEMKRSTETTDELEEIGVIPSRDLRLELSGFTADACWADITDIALKYPNMIGLTYTQKIDGTPAIIGSCLVIEGKLTNGDLGVIVRGANPRQNYILQYNPASFFEQQVAVIESWMQQRAKRDRANPFYRILPKLRRQKIHIVAPPGDSGALSNRPTLCDYADEQYGNKPLVTFNEPVIFNGHDITKSCRIIKTVELNV